MRVAVLKRRDGSKHLVKCYHVSEFHITSIDHLGVTAGRGINYINNILTFDIESTSVIDVEKPYAFMYLWTMVIDGVPIYGNYWHEFFNLLDRVVDWLEPSYKSEHLVCWIHNESFEFQFFKEFLITRYGSIDVFAIDNRKVIKCTLHNGLEFRCSYKLTNMSLDKATKFEKGVEHVKLVGDLDYHKYRTPLTPITQMEFSYAIGDTYILWELIKNTLINNDDTLKTIPLTSTGYVRRAMRKATRQEEGYRKYFYRNWLTVDVFTLLVEAGRGGDTHANRLLSGRLLENCIDSYDKKSSYPWQIYSQFFPIEKFTRYGSLDSISEFNGLLRDYALLFRVTFVNLRVIDNDSFSYISISKTRGRVGRVVADNGRILSVLDETKGLDGIAMVTMTLTDVDFRIIRENYTWDNMLIYDVYYARYGLLPDSIRQTTLEWFRRKCELGYCKDTYEEYSLDDWLEEIKDLVTANTIEDVEYMYNSYKRLLNAIFGMEYTNPCREIIDIEEHGADDVVTWKPKQEPNISEALEKYMKSWNSFNVYAVGVWTTAWGRSELYDLLKATSTNGNMAAYWDTDSSKAHIVDPKPIEELNARLMAKAERLGAVIDVRGVKNYMGLCEKETKVPYFEFKTLGAKKYAYRDSKGVHVTISGVVKNIAPKELKKVDNLKNGFVFEKAGGKVLYYNDAPIHTLELDDGCVIETASSVAIADSTYTVGMTDEYRVLLGQFDEVEYEWQ